MTDQFVECHFDGRLASINLARPEVSNLVNTSMMRQLIAGLATACETDADVLVITASGNDFSIGRDQKEQMPEGMSRRDHLALVVEVNRLLAVFPGISVTGLRGRALGFGAGLVVQSDLCIAADTATLGFDEIRHGFAPSIVMTYLESYVGYKRALDLVVTGRTLSAVEAECFGMVSRVTSVDDLASAMEAMVAGLLERDRDAVRACKNYLHEISLIEPSRRGDYALDRLVGAQ